MSVDQLKRADLRLVVFEHEVDEVIDVFLEPLDVPCVRLPACHQGDEMDAEFGALVHSNCPPAAS